MSTLLQYQYDFLLPLLVMLPFFMAAFLVLIPYNFLAWLLSVLTTFTTFIIALILFFTNDNNLVYSIGNFAKPFGIEIKIDYLNIYFIILVTFIGFITTLWSKKSILAEITTKKANLFYTISLLCFAGTLGILVTNDAFNLFVFLEITSLTTYTLIALAKNKKSSLYAFNYLIMGTIAASLYMFGIGFLYLLFGTLNIDDLATQIAIYPVNPTLILASTLIISGILLKVAIFPVFWWLPKTYQSAPSAVSAFLSGTATKVAIYILIKIIIIVLGKSNYLDLSSFFNLLIVLSIFSMFIGGYLALKQDSLKMLLAYSSISQLGFIIVAIGIYNPITLSASFFIILSHALVKVGLFLCVGNIIYSFGSDKISQIKGLGYKAPLTFITLIYLALSLAGFPGTSGFWGKIYLIIGTLRSYNWFVSIPIILASLFSFYYSWKLIENLWVNVDNNNQEQSFTKIPLYMNIALIIIVLLNIIITIYPSFIYGYIYEVITQTINKG